MTTLPLGDRYRPDRLASPVARGRLYREIRRQRPRVSRDSWYTHTVAPAEQLMPELVALRVYGNDRLKWVVLAAAGLDDYRQPLESGLELHLPSVEWLRDRFRHYEALEAVNVTPAPVLARAQLSGANPSVSLPENEEAAQALQTALAALAEPTPLVSPSDAISDESLNRQRNAIDTKLKAVRDALAKMDTSS